MLYFGYGFFFLCFMISLVAEMRVKSAFDRYSQVLSRRNYTASQVARMILDRHRLSHVRIELVRGNLTDHFDPRAGVIRLSETVYNSTSVAAIGVAAHECGHAVQYAEEYKPIVFRNAIVKSTKICSHLSYILILAGLVVALAVEAAPAIAQLLINLGIIAFGVTTFFQLVTLPVEFNASQRAMATIESYQILTSEEQIGARKVLKAAAMTYVAALIISLLQLLRLIALFRRND